MFKLTKQGLVFSYNGDVITARWPWLIRASGSVYTSDLIPDFNSFKEYWLKRGRDLKGISESKIQCIAQGELLADWTRRAYPASFVITLTDINPNRRVGDFWTRLPAGTLKNLISSDLVVLICKDRSEGLKLCGAIPRDLGEARLLKDGVLIDTNLWADEPESIE